MSKSQININTNTATKQQLELSSDIWILIALALGFFMATLDVTVVTVAVADIQNKLNMGISGATWVVDGYILSFASLLLAGGSLANRYGAKNVYLIGLVFFVLASIFCALAPNGNTLITARIIQGIGAALFMPSSLSLLAFSFSDPVKRAKIFGIWQSIVSVAAGLGPFIGGALVNTLGWQSIFLINIPIGIVGIVLAYFIVEQPPRVQIKLSVISNILGITTLALLSYALIQGPTLGWVSPRIIGIVILMFASGILFIIRENKSKNPIIPKKLFKNKSFSAGNTVGFFINFSMFGGIFMFGLFLQKARGASPFLAGLELLPMMVVFVIGNLLFARLTTKLGVKTPLLLSLLLAAIGSFILTAISPTMPYWIIAVIYAIVNGGIGVAVPAMTAAVMQDAGSNANIAGATLNANRQIGALVGIAVMGAVLDESQNWSNGASNTFLVMSIAYLLATILVWKFVRTKTE
ncbi:MFS transporter [Ectobacillus sp. sgz5001026]|uniref:MFS transporter n=1 Tax=Ectobacillus sp. sgz5001026 TaxID=3242473 RepID=UPI0036D2D5B9